MSWNIHSPWPWTRVVLIDGSFSDRGEIVMRRRAPDGKWQYRRLTQEEQEEEFSRWAW